MFNNVNFTTLKNIVFDAVLGGGITFVVGSLGTYAVRLLQGQSFRAITSDHSVMTCVKVAAITTPLFYLYIKHLHDYEYTPRFLRSSALEIISLATALSVIHYTHAKVTPFLSLALVATHLSWKIFAATHQGGQLLGIRE